MRPRLQALAAVLTLTLAPAARADLGFPDYLKFPPQIVVAPDQALTQQDVAETEFAMDKAGTLRRVKGRHFARWLQYKPAAGEPAPGYYNGTEERIYKAFQAVLARGGWRTVREDENKAAWTMVRGEGAAQVVAQVKMDAPQAQVFVELVEPAAAGAAYTLKPPAAQREKLTLNDDVPWLPPWPGSRRTGQGRGDGPLDVSEPGVSGEPRLVGQAVETRNYQGPSTLSGLQFIGEMRQALLQAGWQVLWPASAEAVRGQGSLAAHYGANGRDIWVRVTYEFGAALSYSVVDAGGDDLAGRLAKDCHVPLYGVFFDFDKATLKPESDAVLSRAAALFKADAALKAEVQGHTDNVGGDDYNLKLSDARAASVKAWFAAHGVDAARLASRGYGRSQPVADNGSAEGRARNRRVELARQGCRK